MVIPVALEQAQRGRPGTLETYDDPLPLVVEIWSPSTGDYDVDTKLPEYQARGDLEIWRIHPFERTLTTWVRQADGRYVETVYSGSVVRPRFLPNVEIDLGQLFEA
jgi:Uma2 family endonuclease